MGITLLAPLPASPGVRYGQQRSQQAHRQGQDRYQVRHDLLAFIPLQIDNPPGRWPGIVRPAQPNNCVASRCAGRWAIGGVFAVAKAYTHQHAAGVALRFDALQALGYATLCHGFTIPGATITPALLVFSL